MSGFTPQQLIEAIGGRWLQPAGTAQRGQAISGRVVIDSRQVQRGDVFWTVPGMQHHGAEYVADALARGAAGVVTETAQPTQWPMTRGWGEAWAIGVEDPRQALSSAAAWQRERFSGSVIGVTGSVGKTTTHLLIHQVLGVRYDGTASPGNFNNQLGLPLSMLGWHADHDYGVLELGASAPQEIGRLASLARPHIGVITQIAEAHLGSFGNRAAIAQAKGELLEHLPLDGWAVLNGDDPQLRRLAARFAVRTTWVGRGADNDLVASKVRSACGWLTFELDGHEYRANLWGRHNLVNVLLAIAIGRSWGLEPDEIAEALAAFRTPAMRCEVTRLGDASLINDAYNSNPTAMRAALELLRDFDSPGRRIVICGDMRELGSESQQLHRDLGGEVVQLCGADMLIACGDYAGEVVAGAQAAGMPQTQTIACRDPEEAAAHAGQVLEAGDVVLVKGSRAVALERCVRALEVITGWRQHRPLAA